MVVLNHSRILACLAAGEVVLLGAWKWVSEWELWREGGKGRYHSAFRCTIDALVDVE